MKLDNMNGGKDGNSVTLSDNSKINGFRKPLDGNILDKVLLKWIIIYSITFYCYFLGFYFKITCTVS
jgi:hypothetical protein